MCVGVLVTVNVGVGDQVCVGVGIGVWVGLLVAEDVGVADQVCVGVDVGSAAVAVGSEEMTVVDVAVMPLVGKKVGVRRGMVVEASDGVADGAVRVSRASAVAVKRAACLTGSPAARNPITAAPIAAAAASKASKT